MASNDRIPNIVAEAINIDLDMLPIIETYQTPNFVFSVTTILLPIMY
jgi:hypothetical protein